MRLVILVHRIVSHALSQLFKAGFRGISAILFAPALSSSSPGLETSAESGATESPSSTGLNFGQKPVFLITAVGAISTKRVNLIVHALADDRLSPLPLDLSTNASIPTTPLKG